jgi:hypothetical protein
VKLPTGLQKRGFTRVYLSVRSGTFGVVDLAGCSRFHSEGLTLGFSVPQNGCQKNCHLNVAPLSCYLQIENDITQTLEFSCLGPDAFFHVGVLFGKASFQFPPSVLLATTIRWNRFFSPQVGAIAMIIDMENTRTMDATRKKINNDQKHSETLECLVPRNDKYGVSTPPKSRSNEHS